MIDSCGTNSGGKLPFSTKHPRQNLCFLRHSATPSFSAPEGELRWHWGSVGTSAVPLQWRSQPFLRTRLAHQKAVNLQTCTIQDTNFSSVLKHTQHLLVAPQPFWSAHPCLNSLNVSAQLKLRKQPKEWIDSVQIICLRQLRPIFKTTPHLSVPQLGFYLSGTSLKKCKITSIILQM